MISKKFKRALEIMIIGAGGYLVNYIMKLTFHRQRPADSLIGPVQQFSFPSGHATSGFIFYGLLAYLIWKSKIDRSFKFPAIILLIAFTILIGFSRIYLKVHYTSDVIAGFCIGFAWLLISIWLLERIEKTSSKL